jgi:galactokinase
MSTVLSRRGIITTGADMLIDTEIPFGAGLSSSAALEIAAGLALTALANAEVLPRELALAGQQVEHEFIGLRSGVMDQLVSALAKAGNALLIDCRSMETSPVLLNLKDMMLAVCDTQVKHELASSAYNKRRAECEEGVELLRAYLPDITALRDVTMQELARYESNLPPQIAKRCRHVVSENARTLEAADAVTEGDLVRVGHLMHLSHDSLRDDYEVSCAELDLLVDTAEGIEGVAGARMTGGGFGGCTINLLKKDIFESFTQQATIAYKAAFGREPVIFAVEPAEGACRVSEPLAV